MPNQFRQPYTMEVSDAHIQALVEAYGYTTPGAVIAYVGSLNLETQAHAAATYQTIAGMSSYLTTAAAAATYQTIAGMSSYLTTAAAAATYQTIALAETAAHATATYMPLAGGTFSGNVLFSAGTIGADGANRPTAIYVSGKVANGNGTAPLPSQTFDSDETTGSYLISAGSYGISCSGALVLTVGTTGISVQDDTDSVNIFGRTRIDSRTTDQMILSHRDSTGANAWALRQTNGGTTTLNGASQGNLASNGTTVWTWSSTGHFIPGAANTYDLGSSGTPVAHLYLGSGSNALDIGGRLRVTNESFTNVNGAIPITMNAVAASGGVPSSFIWSPGNNTAQTAVTEANTVLFNAYTKTWTGSASAFARQRSFFVGAPTYAASGTATTIADAYNGWFQDPIQGSNMTLTRKWSLGTEGGMDIGGAARIAGALDHDGTTVGLYGVAPAAQGTGGQNVTNNVTDSGSTNGTIPDFTDNVIWANDALNVRRALFQITRMLKQDHDQLRAMGALT